MALLDNTCPCGRPIPDTAYTCPTCQTELARSLRRAAELWPHLQATVARQTTVTASPRTSRPRRPATGPACPWCTHPSCQGVRRGQAAARSEPAAAREDKLVFDIAVSEISWVTQETINAWTRYISTRRGWAVSTDTAARLLWLAWNTNWLAHQSEAHNAYDELGKLENLIENAIAQPQATWYAGPCSQCGRDLYADVGADYVECPTCWLHYDVHARRDELLQAVEDQLERAAELARALAGFGLDVTRHRIATWEARGIIIRHGTDPKGRPLYRVGDIIDALHAHTRSA